MAAGGRQASQRGRTSKVKGPDSSALEALDLAIDLEAEGHVFYARLASQIRNRRGRAAIRRLAQDELTHLLTLKAERETLAKEARWLGPKELVQHRKRYEKDLATIFPVDAGARVGLLPRSDVEALKLGIRGERDSLRFYAKLADETDDPVGKAMYYELAKYEYSHLVTLEVNLESLQREKVWYGAR